MESPAAAEIERLRGIWQAADSGISHWRVQGWEFIGSCRELETAISREQAHRYWQTVVKLHTDSQRPSFPELQQITAELFPAKDPRTDQRPLGRWTPYEYLDDGAGRARYLVRDMERLPAFPDGTYTLRVRANGREQMYRNGQRQASVFDVPSQLYFPKRSEFFASGDPRGRALHEVRQPGGRAIITNGFYHLEYESETGFVWRETHQFLSGEYYQETLFALPKRIGSVIVPTLITRLSFWRTPRGNDYPVRMMKLFSVADAGINEQLAEDAFIVGAPAQSVVVHFPAAHQTRDPAPDAELPRKEAIAEPVSDIDSFVKQADFGVRHPVTTPRPVPPDPWDRGSLFRKVMILPIVGYVIWVFVRYWRRPRYDA